MAQISILLKIIWNLFLLFKDVYENTSCPRMRMQNSDKLNYFIAQDQLIFGKL